MTPNPALLDREHFTFRDCVVGGDACWLITPKLLEAPWTPETLMFRSIILRQSDNHVVSLGHLKFFNHGQSPHLYPDPLNYRDWYISTKLDGSLIVVSKHNGELIVRTRGVTSVGEHDTGPEVMKLIYAHGIPAIGLLDGHSLLFEHTSPSRTIVIRYPKPELTLLDIVRHEDCSYLHADLVNMIATRWGLPRPERHTFDSLTQIAETLATLKGMEGYVLSYGGNAFRVKLKASDYLTRHRFKDQATLPNTMDLWFAQGMPDPDTFKANLIAAFDYESFQLVETFWQQTMLAYANVGYAIKATEQKVKPLRALPRRDAALAIQAQIPRLYQSVAFNQLSDKPVDPKQVRRLMEADLEEPTIGVDKASHSRET